MESDDELLKLAERWRVREPDAEFVLEIDRCIAAGEVAELAPYFRTSLSFGTAGLRGPVGWGSGGMNEANVARASWALGQFLLSDSGPNHSGDMPSVVLGFDARPESASYCRLATEILSGLGCRVKFAEHPVPTPLVAYLVRAEGHQAGVVVTASHNPRGDNGFKVYDQAGVQIISPWDTKIAEWIDKFPLWESVRLDRTNISVLSAQDEQCYLNYVQFLCQKAITNRESVPCLIGYTALHGVAGEWVQRALRASSPQAKLVTVHAQQEPDGTFPTTPFPNPEEPGALDMLLALGREHDCDLLIANDPDGDRFAACVREGSDYLKLSGDAIGLIFVDALLADTEVDEPLLVSTIVSSPGIDELARLKGARVERTLTGFKWLCRAALALDGFIFAYEEALGYCFAPPAGQPGVMDKDGIAAAALLVKLLSQDLHSSQGGLLARLRAIYSQIGLFGGASSSRRFEDTAAYSSAEVMGRFMAELRARGPTLDSSWQVIERSDFLRDANERASYLGTQDLLHFRLVRPESSGLEPYSAEVLVRPSGTEAKVKAYVHLRSPFDSSLKLSSQLEDLTKFASSLADSFLSLS